MAKNHKAPAVVAELGRPETPGETATRKARDSRLYRERKTVNNLVFSLLVSLGLVLVIFLMVPRGTGGFADHEVNVTTLAAEASPSAGRDLVAPEVPQEWKAKQAELRGGDKVTSWQINYTTVDPATGHEAYAAVTQAFTSDGEPVEDLWIAQQLEQQAPTGNEKLGGMEWITYDHTDRSSDNSNVLFALQSTWGDDTILVYGTDSPATLRLLATDVAKSLATSKGTE